jgi:hypothetical protein
VHDYLPDRGLVVYPGCAAWLLAAEIPVARACSKPQHPKEGFLLLIVSFAWVLFSFKFQVFPILSGLPSVAISGFEFLPLSASLPLTLSTFNHEEHQVFTPSSLRVWFLTISLSHILSLSKINHGEHRVFFTKFQED